MKFLCIWTNDNPSTYVETCDGEQALQKFMSELSEASGEYPQYVVRGSDLAIAQVRGDYEKWTYKFQ